MHICDFAQGEDVETYGSNPILRQMKYAYHLDLRRFSGDFFGSSAKQTTTVQLQITLKTGPGSRTIKGQVVDWGVQDIGNGHDNRDEALFSNFTFYSYLELLNFFELRSGVYSAK